MAKSTRTTTKKRTRATSKKQQETRSVVRAEFRERYGAAGSCGDEVADKLARATRGADGRPDAAKLRRLAEANGVWQDRYADLNVGMARMNVGNRLRKLARDGAAIRWRVTA